MEKKREIEILQSLKGDTYFNDFFSNEDIDKMCYNIGADFGIECGCKFNEKSVELEAKLKEEKSKHEQALRKMSEAISQRMEDFGRSIIEAAGENMDAKVYDRLEEEFGIAFIIKTKRSFGITLNDSEIDYMISKL